MKRISTLVFSLFILLGASSHAQNIQFNYDFGRDMYSKDLPTRPRVFTTLEHFNMDKWGSNYFFVDMTYSKDGISSAYWEISREFSLGKSPLSLHLEYDGGLSNKYSYNDAYLGGLTYGWNSTKGNFGFTVTPMYKYIRGIDNPNTFQLTGTWRYSFANDKLLFSGFADWWYQDQWFYGNWIFISEPQLWLNLNRLKGFSPDFNLSVGTEWKFYYNFVDEGMKWIPTLALKWTFGK